MLLRMSEPEKRAPMGRIDRMYVSRCQVRKRSQSQDQEKIWGERVCVHVQK